jgi:15-cis-phytoene synthase
MNTTLAASYAHCQQVARRAARNFFYSFLVLPRAKRRAMYALYAFLRHTDDLGDNQQPLEVRRAALARWRDSLAAALRGQFDSPILPALADTVARCSIPPACLHAVIDGVAMDLEERTYETFDELRVYCEKVASAVGLACIHVWGFRDSAALEPARKLGIAFQLTNILRDLKEDADLGRVYLPLEDLRRFGYAREELTRGVRDARFGALMRFQIARAEQFYREGLQLERWLAADGQAALGAMAGIYRELLDEIKRRDGDVFSGRVSVSRWRKARIAARWLLARPASYRALLGLGADPR